MLLCNPNAGEHNKNNRRSQRQQILSILKAGGFVKSTELASVSLQYNARIKELREGIHNDRKFVILAETRGTTYGFVLVGYR